MAGNGRCKKASNGVRKSFNRQRSKLQTWRSFKWAWKKNFKPWKKFQPARKKLQSSRKKASTGCRHGDDGVSGNTGSCGRRHGGATTVVANCYRTTTGCCDEVLLEPTSTGLARMATGSGDGTQRRVADASRGRQPASGPVGASRSGLKRHGCPAMLFWIGCRFV